MKTIQLNVPDMLSQHCQLRVKNALSSVIGVTGITTQPGAVSVQAAEDTEPALIAEKIRQAGYTPEGTEAEPGLTGEDLLRFKTNMHCAGCVSRVGVKLDQLEGVKAWQADLAHPDKVLTVQADAVEIEEIIREVKDAGFEIQPLK